MNVSEVIDCTDQNRRPLPEGPFGTRQVDGPAELWTVSAPSSLSSSSVATNCPLAPRTNVKVPSFSLPNLPLADLATQSFVEGLHVRGDDQESGDETDED
uniref:Uncharacterized protein n=1 Tax=Globodera rostochiensis TaxID=31243 RepID=A0A914HG99_GLORO